MNFDQAFEALIGHEGGYVNSRQDPGGETKYGISKRSYPAEDIPNLTLERAKAIYLRDYWGPLHCDLLPEAAKLQAFDMAVNSSVAEAVKTIQRAVGTTPDGVLGPITLGSIAAMPAERFIARFNGQRLAFMADLPTWPSFGRGWARRIASNLMQA